jgi:hypothetical protein
MFVAIRIVSKNIVVVGMVVSDWILSKKTEQDR